MARGSRHRTRRRSAPSCGASCAASACARSPCAEGRGPPSPGSRRRSPPRSASRSSYSSIPTAPRSPDEIAEVLAVGFGATICDRHLAGIAGLLTAPYAAERAGEIVGLYTITRFKGEGIGERLVARLLGEAAGRGLAYVFACAVDERAVQFFRRLGFAQVDADRVPAAKWAGYDARRRARVVVCKRSLDPGRG